MDVVNNVARTCTTRHERARAQRSLFAKSNLKFMTFRLNCSIQIGRTVCARARCETKSFVVWKILCSRARAPASVLVVILEHRPQEIVIAKSNGLCPITRLQTRASHAVISPCTRIHIYREKPLAAGYHVQQLSCFAHAYIMRISEEWKFMRDFAN